MLSAIDDAGAVIVEDFLNAGELDAVTAELHPHVEQADPDMEHVNEVMQTFYRSVRNVTSLASKSPTFVDAVLLHPLLLAAGDAILGPSCADYTLNVAQLMVREAGATRQWLHRDQEVWSFLSRGHPEVELSSVVALTDFTQENGATAVVPGSHRWDSHRQPEEHEVVPAEMAAGSAVIYLGSTIHAGGSNATSRGRTGIHLSYVVGWLRPEETHTLAVPPAVARRLPRRAQELLGYAMHDATEVGGGYLGCVGLRNPVDLLAAGEL
jgi:ectoine hydroxylase-related dioxygenase (phytanoyl-CoA dioxygenase family)